MLVAAQIKRQQNVLVPEEINFWPVELRLLRIDSAVIKRGAVIERIEIRVMMPAAPSPAKFVIQGE